MGRDKQMSPDQKYKADNQCYVKTSAGNAIDRKKISKFVNDPSGIYLPSSPTNNNCEIKAAANDRGTISNGCRKPKIQKTESTEGPY